MTLAKSFPSPSAIACLANGAVPLLISETLAEEKLVAIAGLLGGNTLVPLAQYSRGQWVRTWPLPDEDVDRAFRSLDELPRGWYPASGGLPTEWFLWNEHLHGVPVRVSAPTIGEAHCQAVWGLSTPLPSSGHETTALATNLQSGIQPFAQSTLDGVRDRPLQAFLQAEAEKAEIAAIRSRRTDADALLARRGSYDRAYELACVRTGTADPELCSFEAWRRLGNPPAVSDAGCNDVVVVQGWVARASAGPTLVEANATVTDCDAKELRTWAPLALIAADARTFVVVREHGYEDESFVVFELRDNQLLRVLEIRGGGC